MHYFKRVICALMGTSVFLLTTYYIGGYNFVGQIEFTDVLFLIGSGVVYVIPVLAGIFANNFLLAVFECLGSIEVDSSAQIATSGKGIYK